MTNWRSKILLVLSCLVYSATAFSQGISNKWLLGYVGTSKASLDFQSGALVIHPDSFKMRFDATEGNISDANGNLLMYSNGIWIANATGDTMLNGNDLNPGWFADDNKKYGMPISYGNVILPWPADTSKYVLVHMTWSTSTIPSNELFYTVIDKTLDNGLGGVILKNQVIFQDSLSWGIGVCKHANGRDWWIVAIKDNSNTLFKVLLTPNGFSPVTSQTFSTLISDYHNACQPVFSPDGSKFAFTTGHYASSVLQTDVNYFEFDRCTGFFSNHQKISTTDNHFSFAAMFSPNSRYLYSATTRFIYQFDTYNFPLIKDTVAHYDGYNFPPPSGFNTDFWLMYRAADDKIYLTCGNSAVQLHRIEAPDSAGLSCNVQQHSVTLPCWYFRTVPNHPNYFLGAEAGSVCDSLTSSIDEVNSQVSLSVWPNPATVAITVNAKNVKGSVSEVCIYSITGKELFKKQVPVHSGYVTQDFYVGNLPSGVYIVMLRTKDAISTLKFVKQ